MPGNSFGYLFRITTAGESHGPGLGVIIEGCPPGIEIDASFIQAELDRRKPGQSSITTQRKEDDMIIIQAGVYQGKSTGAPILLLIPNKDMRPADYDHLKDVFRPSHADYTYYSKYGIRDPGGGGRSSARETANWVAAGAIAKMILQKEGIRIRAAVTRVGEHQIAIPLNQYDWEYAEQNIVRWPDRSSANKIEGSISRIKEEGDTVGGVITCEITGCPPGLGEPVFHKLDADLGHAMLSINAAKGFEIGSGFAGASQKGSSHNDEFFQEGSEVRTKTNNSGGIQGGISNGMPVYFNVAFKPVSTLMQQQASVNTSGESVTIEGKGRHDPCVVPRAVPIVEAMSALVLVDHWLMWRAYR